MAMITCPNCGEQVSDKAKKCVQKCTILDVHIEYYLFIYKAFDII